jgi:hypothetical protein
MNPTSGVAVQCPARLTVLASSSAERGDYREVNSGKSFAAQITGAEVAETEGLMLPQLFPMLAVGAEPFDDPDHYFEIKWDGATAPTLQQPRRTC